MKVTLAVEGLVRNWIQDIRAQVELSAGQFQARLIVVDALDRGLAALKREKWFDVLPIGGRSQGFYSANVLPLQRDRAWDDHQFTVQLVEHINDIRWRLMLQPRLEQRMEASLEASTAWWDLLLLGVDPDVIHAHGLGYIGPWRSEEPTLYFAFVEDVETIPAGEALYGANGIQIQRPLTLAEQIHIRFSAILVGQFFELTDQISPIDPESVTPEERIGRRQQLSNELDDVALPVLDMLLQADARRLLRTEPAFGDWCLLGLNSEPRMEEGFSIYMTDPENGERPTTTPAGLSLLVQAPDFWQDRLRDIFSLVHIPDADFGETERGEGAPVPIPPMAPQIQEMDKTEAPREEEAKERSPFYRSAG